MKRVYLPLAGLAVAALVGAILIKLHASQKPPSIVLPNGCAVTYLGSSVSNAPFTTEKGWQKLARKFLPARFTGWMPSPITGSCGYESNTVCLYFDLNPDPGTLPWNQNAADDASGFRFFQGGMSSCSFGGGGGTRRIHGILLRALPRRDPSFVLHFMDWNSKILGSMTIPNPVQGPFAEWKPQPLPQTETNGPVSLTIRGVVMRGGGSRPHEYVEPSFKVASTDSKWSKAGVRYYTLSDATGNKGQFLSTNEPAWKVHASVFRERMEDFEPEERMVVTNLSIPQTTNFTILDKAAECAGVKLRVQAIAGPGRLTVTNNVSWSMSAGTGSGSGSSSGDNWTTVYWDSTVPFIIVHAEQAQQDDELEFFTLSGGQRKKLSSYGYNGSPGGGRNYQLKLESTNLAEPFDFEARVNRPRQFVFVVSPAELKRR